MKRAAGVDIGGYTRPKITQALSDLSGPAGRGQRARVVAEIVEAVGEKRHDAPQTPRVVELDGDRLGLAQAGQRPLVMAEQGERVAEVEPDVNGPDTKIAARLRLVQGAERALEVVDGGAARRARERARARHVGVRGRALPGLAAEGVLGERFGVRVGLPGVEDLQRPLRLAVQRALAFGRQAPVGDEMRERVLERVGGLGPARRRIDEFGLLQRVQALAETVLGKARHRHQRGATEVHADHRAAL